MKRFIILLTCLLYSHEWEVFQTSHEWLTIVVCHNCGKHKIIKEK